MAAPKVAGKEPEVMELEAGTYHWCGCGLSKSQPFCDGSHEGSGLSPMEFTLKDQKIVALCMCKHTKKPPFCDGSHTKA